MQLALGPGLGLFDLRELALYLAFKRFGKYLGPVFPRSEAKRKQVPPHQEWFGFGVDGPKYSCFL